MADRELDELTALLPPLLRGLDALAFVSRYFYPPRLAGVIAAIGAPDDDLRKARDAITVWPDGLADVRAALAAASDEALAALSELRTLAPGDDPRAAYRALRRLPRAQEALYPLAAAIPPLNRYFLAPDQRGDPERQARLFQTAPREDTGVFHVRNEIGSRGGFSLYVPEYYTADSAWPLVVALHGGGGHGRSFLWSWLRDARSQGAILLAPTALGATWAIADDDDADTPNITALVDQIRARWRIDPSRILMSGMSDGGTFCYASGLDARSPFTHLAPVSASFHPVLAQMADPARLAGLPIHIAHGALDWMFPVDVARQARDALGTAGADVSYVEYDDLSHCYPVEFNTVLLQWLAA